MAVPAPSNNRGPEAFENGEQTIATATATQSWDIYLARRTPAKWIGTVKAVDFEAAIKEATQRFEVQAARKLLVVRQR